LFLQFSPKLASPIYSSKISIGISEFAEKSAVPAWTLSLGQFRRFSRWPMSRKFEDS
jgi:hypothetical protein